MEKPKKKSKVTPRKEGRPTKYKPEYVKVARDYIDSVSIPYVQQLALNLDVDIDTILESWTKMDKEFFRTIKRLKTKQELGLLTEETINPTMRIFQLKCNHGYIETSKSQVELSGDGLNIELTTYKGKKK